MWNIIYNFTFYYPLLMSVVIIVGALCYHFFREKRQTPKAPVLDKNPLVTILIPCHNEAECIRETIEYLERQTYTHYEIIAINDASTDDTLSILKDLQKTRDNLRVLTMRSNQGKGMGLTMGALISRGEYLVCIDADALLDKDAVRHMIWHFIHFPRVGAVTGNPRIRNRTSLLGKIQVGEFSSIVGMIKRTQRILGKVYTVSGVIAAFRKRALLSVGFWSTDMVTEDIDISWKLQCNFWDIRYEPHAMCWILMPETVRGLFNQRLRWAQGGSQVLRKYFTKMFSFRQRRIWPIYIEYTVSVLWAYFFFLTMFMCLLTNLFTLPTYMQVRTILPGWTGVLLAIMCLSQIGVGLLIDSKFEKNILGIFFWLIWYPCIYWFINAIVSVIGFPKAFLQKKGTPAIWESPDRGF